MLDKIMCYLLALFPVFAAITLYMGWPGELILWYCVPIGLVVVVAEVYDLITVDPDDYE
ncbi:hypothetical protein [Salinivibrio phage CW02]|uniref:Uncharacterized protein n=1 Tax=Salinivibrio phage CW02 TaxID=1161935 RepID=H9D1I6_9CAUD|nr:hypothetical protein F490_gp09 [Salinivibrio phage CW02]AFE86228.1 hypothetical protein [Salinivibrio phage CW02]